MRAKRATAVPTSFAFVDTETTGGSALRNRIIDIAVIVVENGVVTETYSSLVDPEEPIPPMIQGFTGITNEDVATAPTFAGIARDVLRLLEGRVFVAHNARFDYGFLKNELRRAGFGFQAKTLCTVKLSRLVSPGERSHSLDTVIERFGITCKRRHRALGDTEAMCDFWFRAQTELGSQKFQSAVGSLLRVPSLPPALPSDSLEQLPETPGVYIFHGKRSPIYIGKSVNIRSRVLSHFSGDHRTAVDGKIVREIQRVEYRETAGELGALLLESRLVKEQLPLFNRKLRRASAQCTIRLVEDTDGFLRPKIVEGCTLDAGAIGSIYGLFRGPRAAQHALAGIAESNRLCGKLLGLEAMRKAPEPCFAYQLGGCRGACAGKESATEHNIRLQAALITLKHKRWPFDGVLAVEETCGERGLTDVHLFHQWCYLGTYTDDVDVRDALASPSALDFDMDTYLLLSSFLRTKGKQPGKKLRIRTFPLTEKAISTAL